MCARHVRSNSGTRRLPAVPCWHVPRRPWANSVRELHDGMEPLPPPALVDGAFPAGPAGSAVLDWIGALRELPLLLFNLSWRCWRMSTSLAP